MESDFQCGHHQHHLGFSIMFTVAIVIDIIIWSPANYTIKKCCDRSDHSHFHSHIDFTVDLKLTEQLV